MKIAIIGSFQVGKSTLVNCLIGGSLAGVGLGTPTTHTLNYYKNSFTPGILCRDITGKCLSKKGWDDVCHELPIPQGTVRIMYELPADFKLHPNVLIDTPGLDASGNDASWDSMRTSDVIHDHSVDLLILVVSNKQLDAALKNKVLPLIKASGKKVIVLMNCNQKGISPDPGASGNLKTARQIDEELRIAGIRHDRVSEHEGSKVLPCNAAWWWIAQHEKQSRFSHSEQVSLVFHERYQEIRNYYSIILNQQVPSFERLQQKSNLSHVFAYLNDDELRDKLWGADNPSLSLDQLRWELQKRITR